LIAAAIVERKTKIEILVTKTDELKSTSDQFHKGAGRLKRQFQWKNIKMYLILGGVALLIVLILLLVVCKPDFSKCGA